MISNLSIISFDGRLSLAPFDRDMKDRRFWTQKGVSMEIVLVCKTLEFTCICATSTDTFYGVIGF